MPLYDFSCEDCGWEYEDVYMSNSNHEPVLCRTMTKKVVRLDVDEETGEEFEFVSKETGCDSKEPLVRLIGAPAPPVIRVGKYGDPRTRKEESINKRRKLLKRSYDHEFKKGRVGKRGSEERRAHIEKLKKAGVPVVGKLGF